MVDFLFSLISFEGKRENLYQVILNSVEKHKSFVYKYPRKSLNALNKMPANLLEISKASSIYEGYSGRPAGELVE